MQLSALSGGWAMDGGGSSSGTVGSQPGMTTDAFTCTQQIKGTFYPGPTGSTGMCVPPAPVVAPAPPPPPPAPVISPVITVNPAIQTQVSPQISPVFQQSYMPQNSPMSAGTSQQAPGGFASGGQPSGTSYGSELATLAAQQNKMLELMMNKLSQPAPAPAPAPVAAPAPMPSAAPLPVVGTSPISADLVATGDAGANLPDISAAKMAIQNAAGGQMPPALPIAKAKSNMALYAAGAAVVLLIVAMSARKAKK